tara:strand:- start:1141 stop:1518 length:378 start_codon:yes stop_codon:yes gene_type:complete
MGDIKTGKEVKDIFEKIFGELVENKSVLDEALSYTTMHVKYLYNFVSDESEKEARLLFDSLGEIKNVEQVSTTDGDAFTILQVPKFNVFIKVQGRWNSYENYADYEDASFYVVEPKQQTITVYTR